jgi:hypothetical protein
MNALAHSAKHTGALVLGIDHFGKVQETGTRGSSAKEAGADTVVALLAEWWRQEHPDSHPQAARQYIRDRDTVYRQNARSRL